MNLDIATGGELNGEFHTTSAAPADDDACTFALHVSGPRTGGSQDCRNGRSSALK